MALARRLLAQMDMHHAGAGVEGGLRLARHLLRRNRDVMLLRVGQHAVQRAGDDSLVAHGSAFDCVEVATRDPADHASGIIRLLASTRYRRRRCVLAVDRKVAGAREDRARLQPVKAPDRVAEMGGVGIADFLRQMRQIEVLIGEMQQVPRAFPGPEGAEGDTGLLLEQMQEARGDNPASAAQLGAVTGSPENRPICAIACTTRGSRAAAAALRQST